MEEGGKGKDGKGGRKSGKGRKREAKGRREGGGRGVGEGKARKGDRTEAALLALSDGRGGCTCPVKEGMWKWIASANRNTVERSLQEGNPISIVFQNIDPPSPSPPRRVYPPRLCCGGRTDSPDGEGDGGSIFWKTREIGLPSCNDLSTKNTHSHIEQ